MRRRPSDSQIRRARSKVTRVQSILFCAGLSATKIHTAKLTPAKAHFRFCARADAFRAGSSGFSARAAAHFRSLVHKYRFASAPLLPGKPIWGTCGRPAKHFFSQTRRTGKVWADTDFSLFSFPPDVVHDFSLISKIVLSVFSFFCYNSYESGFSPKSQKLLLIICASCMFSKQNSQTGVIEIVCNHQPGTVGTARLYGQ